MTLVESTVLGVTIEEIVVDFGPATTRLVAVLLITWLAARVARRMTTRVPEKFMRQAAYIAPKVIWTFGLLILLGSLGINITSLMTLMATLGLAGALVFTPVGQSLVAGFLAGMDDVVNEGDVITVQDRAGRVVRKGALSLGVEFPDGSLVYMPNTKVVDDELTNHNRVAGNRIDVEVKLNGSPDRAAAVAVMEGVLDELPWHLESRPTAVHFTEVGSGAFHYRCFAWIENRIEEPRYKSDLLTRLVDGLEAAGISVGETGNLSASDFLLTIDAPGAAFSDVDLTATSAGNA